MGGELELERAGQEDWAEGLRSGREDGWRAGRRVRGLEGRAGPQRGSEDGGVPLDSPVVPLYPATLCAQEEEHKATMPTDEAGRDSTVRHGLAR